MGVVDIGYPIAEGLVDGVLQGAGAVLYRHHRGAHLFHPEDIGALPLDIDLAHINGAVKTEFGGHGGRGHAVLAGAGLGDHPFFAHPFDQQALAHDIVGLVGAGVVEVFAFDVDLGPAEMAGQIFGKGQRRGPAGVGGHELQVLLPEGRIILASREFCFQFLKGLMEHLRDVRPAPVAEKTLFIH